jgi:hypothetical protein
MRRNDAATRTSAGSKKTGLPGGIFGVILYLFIQQCCVAHFSFCTNLGGPATPSPELGEVYNWEWFLQKGC